MWGPRQCAAIVALVLLVSLPASPVSGQTDTGVDEIVDTRTCEEVYNGTNCWQRMGWSPGLVNPDDPRVYQEPGGFYRVHDDIIALAAQVYLDDANKDPYTQLIGTGQRSYCFFPFLYYACASAFQQCREDGNKTVDLEINAPPPPLGTRDVPPEVMEFERNQWRIKAKILARVPIYPCLDYCADPEIQQCKDVLVEAINTTLADLPNVADYVAPIEDWFDCNLLQERSEYAFSNDSYFCLGRPHPPAPPPSPPPPPLPPVPSQPAEGSEGGERLAPGAWGLAVSLLLLIMGAGFLER